MRKRVLSILMAMAVSVGGVSIPTYANEGYEVEEVGVATENDEVTEESVSSNTVQTVSTNDLEADTTDATETTDDVYVADVDELEADEAEVETVDIKDVQEIEFQKENPNHYKYDPTVIEKGNIDCSEGSLTYKVYDNGLRMIIEGNGTLKDVKSLQDKLVKSYKCGLLKDNIDENGEFCVQDYVCVQQLVILGRVKLPKDSSYLFHYPDNPYYSTGYNALSRIFLRVTGTENFDTSMVENMSHMFEGCVYDVDISTWDTSKVTDMSYMFEGFEGKITGLENFNTSMVTDMSHMFEGVTMETFCYPNFDVRNVKDMQSIFERSHIGTIDLSKWTLNSETCLDHFITNGETNIVKLPKIDSDEAACIRFTSWNTNNKNNMKIIFPKEKYYKYVLSNYSLHGDNVFASYDKLPIEEVAKKKNKTIKGTKYELFVIDKNEVGISGITTDKNNFTIPSKIKIGKKTYKVTYLAGRSSNYFSGIFKGPSTPLKVVVPSTIKEIPNNAFSGCLNLREVVIGKNVNKIGINAFWGCKYLKKVTFKGTKVKSIGTSAFEGVSKKIVVKAPKSKLKAYKKMIKASR